MGVKSNVKGIYKMHVPLTTIYVLNMALFCAAVLFLALTVESIIRSSQKEWFFTRTQKKLTKDA